MMSKDIISGLAPEESLAEQLALGSISPDDAKYRKASAQLSGYLSAEAEWLGCAYVQRVLLETRVEFGQAEQWHLEEFDAAQHELSALNMSMIEGNITKHDQLAVIEEIGRHVSPETKALLHPGTTSYDILDTARSFLFKKAWFEAIRPEVCRSIDKICDLSERFNEEPDKYLQPGRTHLQNTSPVPFGTTLAGYAARLAKRTDRCDSYFDELRGKISGIVGTGAGIEMVIGKDKSMEFEKAVLKKLGLKPDHTATQIVQKEGLADAGHGLTVLMHVLADLADDIRMMYSSAIGEVTSRSNEERLGGSSADATKNNPINWENIAGKASIVESGMRVLYGMINTDFQRDLRSSVQARYQPQMMMTQVYESFLRLNKKCLPNLSVNYEAMAANLVKVRENPGEAMVAILKGENWIHTKHVTGHNFVKEMGKTAKKTGKPLLQVALKDPEFKAVYESLEQDKKDILNGRLEKYTGSAVERAHYNIDYARMIIRRR